MIEFKWWSPRKKEYDDWWLPQCYPNPDLLNHDYGLFISVKNKEQCLRNCKELNQNILNDAFAQLKDAQENYDQMIKQLLNLDYDKYNNENKELK